MSGGQSWLHHAFGFSGRANRAKFWLIPLVPLAAIVLLVMLSIPGSDSPFTGFGGLLLPVVMLIAMWVGIAVTVRRLHDRNKSGHWAWLYLGAPAILNGLDAATGNPGNVTVVTLIGFAITLWYLVDCGFIKGTQGPNKYGPDPLGTTN